MRNSAPRLASGAKGLVMARKKKDPVDELAAGVAADFTTAKNNGEVGDVSAPLPGEAEPQEAQADGEEREPAFIGEFPTFDAVRDFAKDSEFELIAGDLTVVNGALVRVKPDLTFNTLLSDLLEEFAPPADHVAAFSRGLDDMERVVLEAKFESGGLLANLRDTIIELFKARPKVWSQMSQMEQRDTAKQIEAQAETLIRKIVRVVTEGETISVSGKLDRYTHAGTFDLKISAASDEETALELFRMQGHDILIMSADAKRFLDAPEAKTDPDEPVLELVLAEPEQGEEPAPYNPPDDDSDLADAAGDGDDFDPDAATGSADDNSDLGAAVEAVAQAEPEPDPGTGAAAIAAMNAAAKDEADDDSPGEYESRSNPDDDPDGDEPTPVVTTAGDFEEATAEELNAQEGRPKRAPYDYVGPSSPSAPAFGESWLNTNDVVVKYWHGGGWYLNPPDNDADETVAAIDGPLGTGDEDFPEG